MREREKRGKGRWMRKKRREVDGKRNGNRKRERATGAKETRKENERTKHDGREGEME